jgi:DNA-binding winged helix-turn-helix (wHTH) protein
VSLTVRQRIEGQAAAVVGRESERVVLRQMLSADRPLVVFIHGIAGVGKTALIEAFSVEARTRGAIVLRLDCGEIEPTERGFLAALSGAVGGELLSVDDAATRLASLGDRVVLLLDTYEVLRPLDPWLRQAFVPAISDRVRIIFAGREPPMTGWPSSLGALFRSLPLANLPREDANALLRQAGIVGADADRINRIARGHPLSLRLAGAALLESPGVDHEASTVNALVEALAELYLARLDPATRQVLDAASVVRRPTTSLLAAMLPETAPQDAIERLRTLPFVEVGNDGLIVHETVREVVAAFLRSSDPDRSRRYRVAAWRQLREEVARATPEEMWRYTADLLYILENPVIREAFFPTTEHLYFVETAQPADGPAIAEIIGLHEPPAAAAIIETWWQRAPTAFRVARDGAGAIAGFYVVCQLGSLTPALIDVDPVARRWLDHLRHNPVPAGRRVLFERIELAREFDDSMSAVLAAILLDLKRMYMELRPELRRIYSIDWEPIAPGSAWARLGIGPLPGEPLELGGVTYYLTFLDFGPASVDGWLTRVIAAELQVEDDSILDVAQRQLVLDGHRVDLTKLEFEVLNYLYQRPGKVVERSALLRDVWGYDYAASSNVIPALVASMRRKLGDHASAIETVRGLGYRFVAPNTSAAWSPPNPSEVEGGRR